MVEVNIKISDTTVTQFFEFLSKRDHLSDIPSDCEGFERSCMKDRGEFKCPFAKKEDNESTLDSALEEFSTKLESNPWFETYISLLKSIIGGRDPNLDLPYSRPMYSYLGVAPDFYPKIDFKEMIHELYKIALTRESADIFRTKFDQLFSEGFVSDWSQILLSVSEFIWYLIIDMSDMFIDSVSECISQNLSPEVKQYSNQIKLLFKDKRTVFRMCDVLFDHVRKYLNSPDRLLSSLSELDFSQILSVNRPKCDSKEESSPTIPSNEEMAELMKFAVENIRTMVPTLADTLSRLTNACPTSVQSSPVITPEQVE